MSSFQQKLAKKHENMTHTVEKKQATETVRATRCQT